MRTIRIGLLVALALAMSGAGASAAMGGKTMMERLDADHDGKLTLDEVRAAAGRKYETISRANGGKVTLLQLGGRVSTADLKDAKIGEGEASARITKDDYLALAAHFFGKASHRENSDASDGTLGVGELSTPAGKNLLGMLQ